MNGYCDIVIIGDGFKGRSLDAKFKTLAEKIKVNLLKREPFATRASELRFHVINSKANLQCKTTGGLETALVCDWQAIKKQLGETPINVVHVLDYSAGYGGCVGNTSAAGCGKLIDTQKGNTNYCSDGKGNYIDLETRLTDGVSIHEIIHSFIGDQHDFNSLNVMSYATNGGCFLVNTPLTIAHQQIVQDFIDRAKNTIV